MPSAIYTYVRNADPANDAKEILLRGGSLKLRLGQYAELTEEEVRDIKNSGAQVIEEGIIGNAKPADWEVQPEYEP